MASGDGLEAEGEEMKRTGSWAIFCVSLLATGAGAAACSSSGAVDNSDAGELGGEGGACAGASCGAGGSAEDAGSGGTRDTLADGGAGGDRGDAGEAGLGGEPG